MNNLLIVLLHCQLRMQNDTMHALQVIHQSQKDHANDSLTDDIPIFDGKPEVYFNWILKLDNIDAVTKHKPKGLALG